MATSSLPDDDPSHLDSIHPNPATQPSSPPSRPPHQDLYLSLADIEDLSQQTPASPRHHRNNTYDHSSAETPIARSHARFAGGHDHSGSVDSPLRPGFEPQSLPTEDNHQTSHLLEPSFALRDLDQYPRGHPAYSRSGSRSREDDESHGTVTPALSHYHSAVETYPDSEHQDDASRPESGVYDHYDHYDHYDSSRRDSYFEFDDYDGEIGEAVAYGGNEMPNAKPENLQIAIETPTTTTSSFPKRSTSIKKGARKIRTQQDAEPLPQSHSQSHSQSNSQDQTDLQPQSSKLENTRSPEKSFFWSWGKPRQSSTMQSPSTQFSDGTPMSAEQHQANVQPNSASVYNDDDHYFGSELDYSPRSASPSPYGHSGISTNVTELLKELQEVSAELAASIHREMELEDEIDRVQSDMPSGPPGELSRRTSDYYSDSGASSAKLPMADLDLKLQGLERMRRKAEQEKAQLRVDMAQKVQEGLNERRALEMHVQSLEEQVAAASGSQELEAQVDDLKRKLNDEKAFKANFDDLLSGMREEIEAMRNDRDNLRDEVVPKLKAQLEGMESETSEAQNLAYENARMQQEIQTLKNENQTLQNARKLQSDSRFRTISEEPNSGSSSPTLSRSNSLARSRSTRARSGSLIGNDARDPAGPTESLPDRIKNIEEQRDALHRTLKSLLLRQDQLSKKHNKQMSLLKTERDRALSGLPKRQAFHVEVQSLRTEINELRHRADEALEQKFQCEKGLSGLKMDLDRAQQETSSLRELLEEHDIPAPASTSPHSSYSSADGADSLDRAFASLRRAHADSLAAGHDIPAEARMAALATQVSTQQASNRELHARLAEAIERGEKEQAASARKINDLQSALRNAEERVMAAQSASEDAIADEEDAARDLKEGRADQELRSIAPLNKNALPEKKGGAYGGLFGRRGPQLEHTSSGKGGSLSEAARTVSLERKVKELEDAAVGAEQEMQGVVERMNRAQIEVADLQTQRDDAMRQTKMLQREIDGEREKVGKRK